MRVLVACSLGGAGHLAPLLPFVRSLTEAGDEVVVTGPPSILEGVAEANVSLWPGREPEEREVSRIREQLAVASRPRATILGNRELFGRLATTAMLPAVRQLCADWRPDLILREPCEYASAVVAGEQGIPSTQVAISLAAGELTSIEAAAPALERHRTGLVQELTHSPYLTRFPASLDPPLFATTVRYRDAPARPSRPLPDWWSSSRAPLLYVTFGSVLGSMAIAAPAFDVALEAVTPLERLRVLITVGRRFPFSETRPIPPHVHVEPWVEQADVLADASLVLCHGGSGTVLGALGAGVPVVVAPFFADQFANASLVARSGAGITVAIPHRDHAGPAGQPAAVALQVRHAVETVLADPTYHHAARAISEELMAPSPPSAALAEVDRALAWRRT